VTVLDSGRELSASARRTAARAGPLFGELEPGGRGAGEAGTAPGAGEGSTEARPAPPASLPPSLRQHAGACALCQSVARCHCRRTACHSLLQDRCNRIVPAFFSTVRRIFRRQQPVQIDGKFCGFLSRARFCVTYSFLQVLMWVKI